MYKELGPCHFFWQNGEYRQRIIGSQWPESLRQTERTGTAPSTNCPTPPTWLKKWHGPKWFLGRHRRHPPTCRVPCVAPGPPGPVAVPCSGRSGRRPGPAGPIGHRGNIRLSPIKRTCGGTTILRLLRAPPFLRCQLAAKSARDARSPCVWISPRMVDVIYTPIGKNSPLAFVNSPINCLASRFPGKSSAAPSAKAARKRPLGLIRKPLAGALESNA